MKPGQSRGLTAGEIVLGRSVFGDEIAWLKIRIYQGPRLGFGAMVPVGRTIVFSKWRAAHDFGAASLWDQGWFVHELTHVWQAARGVVLAAAKLSALGKGAYAYTPRTPKLNAYNIERQAEIVRHLFLARANAPEAGAPTKEWLEEAWASR
ncbi:MAG: vgr related protein [Alphaproteobacteria bacterium]|nr:vgr related protein [Alphaproteobacteria bacterium]